MEDKELFNKLKELRETKDIDQIAEAIREIVGVYGLTMAEVAAVNYYIMEQALKTPVNKLFIKDNFSIDVDTLSIDGMLQIQRALVVTYVESIKSVGSKKEA